MRRAEGSLHLKDLFTLVNLAAGVLAVRFIVLDDQPRRAGYAVMVGFLLGDLLDGQVARRTGTANRVGAELDTLVDHFVHVVVPGLIIFEVYADGDHGWLGLAAMGVLVAAATIRHARFASSPFEFPKCWCGLPRTVSGFAAMTIVLSHAFTTGPQVDYYIVFGVVLALAAMNVVPVPYLTHRSTGGLRWWGKLMIVLFLVTPIIVFATDRTLTFDVLAFWVLGYAATGWVPINREDRAAFYDEYRRWNRELATR